MKIKNLTIKDIGTTIRQNLIWILLFIMVAQACVYMYQNYYVPKQYSAETEVLVNVESDKENLQQEGIRNNIQLINTFSSVLKSERIMEEVAEDIHTEKSPSVLRKNLTMSSDQNSLVFKFNYQSTNEKEVEEISHSYIK
ncbi:YveK family protein [Listeria aquatica]|uniref:YveK family protein n=1 Tax=Listeria aquatica TaxID=1494960 RepID=UPI001FD0CC67|nr:Wzz/FepE/Etk N-terminal domain-containing protein [Listeria aquatica]